MPTVVKSAVGLVQVVIIVIVVTIIVDVSIVVVIVATVVSGIGIVVVVAAATRVRSRTVALISRFVAHSAVRRLSGEIEVAAVVVMVKLQIM